MFEFIVIVLFVWLSIKTLGLALKLTWGLANIAAIILLVMALPVLIGCLLVAGGIILLLPLGLAALACGIVYCS